MAPRIQLSESELKQLADNSRKQQQNVDDVTKAGETAVGVAGGGWQSQAFQTFDACWQQDRGKLTQLSQELANWQKQCMQHSAVAHRVNQPFR
jgi:uncharacterized protein YukE